MFLCGLIDCGLLLCVVRWCYSVGSMYLVIISGLLWCWNIEWCVVNVCGVCVFCNVWFVSVYSGWLVIMCWFMSVECLICGLLYSSFVSGCVCSCCMVCYMFLLVVSGVMLCVVIYGVLLIDRIILCIYIGVCGELVSVFGLLNYGELMVLCVMCMFMWLSCVRCVVSDLLCVS